METLKEIDNFKGYYVSPKGTVITYVNNKANCLKIREDRKSCYVIINKKKYYVKDLVKKVFDKDLKTIDIHYDLERRMINKKSKYIEETEYYWILRMPFVDIHTLYSKRNYNLYSVERFRDLILRFDENTGINVKNYQ